MKTDHESRYTEREAARRAIAIEQLIILRPQVTLCLLNIDRKAKQKGRLCRFTQAQVPDKGREVLKPVGTPVRGYSRTP